MNKIRKIKNHSVIILTAISISAFSIIPSYADYKGAILSEIEINPYHDSSYQIVVRTDKGVPIEKQIISDNEIALNLKNTKPSRFVNTIYNNATRVSHVIIQPASGNRVKVFLQGANMAASKITLDTKGNSLDLDENEEPATITLTGPNVANNSQNKELAANKTPNPVQIPASAQNAPVVPAPPVLPIEEIKPQQEQIILQHPVRRFKPIDVTDVDDLENSDDSSVSEMQKAMIGNIFNTGNLDWVLRLSMLAILIIGGMKLLKPKEGKVKINLAGDLKTREVDLFKQLNNREGLIGSGLKSSQNKSIISKPGYNSISNYGIKEYKNSYELPKSLNSGSAMPRAKIEPKYNRPNEPLLKKPLNTQKAAPQTAAKTLNTGKITQKDINNAKVNIDSQKFLETMAKIYESSGRKDLAQGIKHNISRFEK